MILRDNRIDRPMINVFFTLIIYFFVATSIEGSLLYNLMIVKVDNSRYRESLINFCFYSCLRFLLGIPNFAWFFLCVCLKCLLKWHLIWVRICFFKKVIHKMWYTRRHHRMHICIIDLHWHSKNRFSIYALYLQYW